MSVSSAPSVATRSNFPASSLRADSSVSANSSRSSLQSLASGNSPREDLAVESLQRQLQSQAQQDPAGFRASLEAAFGGKASPAELDQLLDMALAGKLPMPDNIEFVDAGSLGANAKGAYSSENGGTLYLDRSLLSNPDKLQDVFNEELGHHLDAHLGGADAAGDEGAIFAQTLKDGPVSTSELAALRSENDSGVVWLDGRSVRVEFSMDEAAAGMDDSEVTSNSDNTGSAAPSNDDSGEDDSGESDDNDVATAPESNTSSGNDAPVVEPEPEPEQSSGWFSRSLDVLQTGLDFAGFIPGFGAIPDLANAGIHAARGNKADAALSLAAAVPVIGDAAKGTVMGARAIDRTLDATRGVDSLNDARRVGDDALPDGMFRDSGGRVRNADGTFASDPARVVGDLNRPYVRTQTRATVEARAPRAADGRFIDPNTGRPIDGSYDLGHKPGHEFRREKARAEAEGLTQAEFNDRMNDPDLYQIEDPSSNRSHQFELPGND